MKARQEGIIQNESAAMSLIDKMDNYRTSSAMLLNFKLASIPEVYTQVTMFRECQCQVPKTYS